MGMTRNDTEEATWLLCSSKKFGSCYQGLGGPLKNFRGMGKLLT